MLDFNIQLPKNGETRVKAIRQIAVLFRSLIESEESLTEDATPEQSVLAFIQKQLRGSEAAMFLAFVYPDTETLPSEFEAYNIVTLSNVIDEYLNLRRIMDVNDLLAFESDANIEKIAKACGIGTRLIRQADADPRMMMVRRIHANLNNYEHMFPTANALLEYFGERYAYDKYSESDRWTQLATRLDMTRLVRQDDTIILSAIGDELDHWNEEAFRVLVQMLDIDDSSNRSYALMRSICAIGPQEVLKRLHDKDLITSAQYAEWMYFNDLSFIETLQIIATFWVAVHDGKEKVSGQLDDNAKEMIDRFASAYKDDEELEDEEDEEDDEEDDEEEDFEEEDEEDEEDEDETPASPKRKSPIVRATAEELYAALKAMHDDDDDFEFEEKQYALASTSALRSALFRAVQENVLSKDVSLITIGEMRHYELLELFFNEVNEDYFDYGDKLQAAFEEWLEDTEFKRLQFFRPLIESIVPAQDTSSFDASEAEEWLLEHCLEQENADAVYRFVARVNALAAKHGIAFFSVEPEEPAVEPEAETKTEFAPSAAFERAIALGMPPTKARTMSASELKAFIAEAEMENAPESRNVTADNYREVIPVLSRQELIAELASRGYSDKSLNKLGAPRLAEIFIAAMDRLVAKS